MTRTLPPALVLTPAAVARLQAIMAAKPEALGLRVDVASSGCSGLRYGYTYAERVEAGELLVEQSGVRVVMSPAAQLYATGSTLDFVTRGLSEAFEITGNPMEAGRCGCGESFTPKA